MEQIKVTHDRVDVTLHADAYAYVNDVKSDLDDQVVLLSVAGPERAIKGLFGVLHSNNTKAEIKIGYHKLKPVKQGYNTYKICIDEETRTWHMIAIAKIDGFLPAWDTNALWNELRKDRFTTPVIKPWMPWIKEHIENHGQVRLTKHNCNCLLFAPNVVSETLDRLVVRGLQKGEIAIG